MANDDQEKGLGILVLQSDHSHLSITNEDLLCLTSDEESIAGDNEEPISDKKSGCLLSNEANLVDRKSEQNTTDTLSEFKLSSQRSQNRSRSFISFDDQAQILEQASAVYQKRKEIGFKDLGLQKHIDECVKTRANLRDIGDPEVLRKKKIADFIEEFKRTKPRGKHTHGLSEAEVKERRANLRRVEEISTPGGNSNTSTSPSPDVLPIARARSRLRSASSPRKSPEAKKWAPPSTPVKAAAMPSSPLSFIFGVKKSPRNDLVATERTKAKYLQPPMDATGANSSIAESDEVPAKTKELCYDLKRAKTSTEDDTKQGSLSPLQIQKSKLRSIGRHDPTSTTPSGDSTEKNDDEVPQSPYQAQRQRLRATKTKPRAYNCSILLVEGHQRKDRLEHHMTARYSKNDTEKGGVSGGQTPQTWSTNSSEIDLCTAFDTTKVAATVEDTKSGIPPVENSLDVDSGRPVLPSSIDVSMQKRPKNGVAVQFECSKHNMSTGFDKESFDVPVQEEESIGAFLEEKLPESSSEILVPLEGTGVSLEKYKRRTPRRISSENVLRKRAEMEIRSQIDRARNRLHAYHTHCTKSREDHSRVQNKLLKKLESTRRKLSSARVKSLETIRTRTDILAEVMNWEDGLDEEQRECEGDLVLHMQCMIALEKQEELTVRDANAIKTFLLRCKAWLQDYEMVLNYLKELESNNMALQRAYESILRQQTSFIACRGMES
jgi:hypothetical protein